MDASVKNAGRDAATGGALEFAFPHRRFGPRRGARSLRFSVTLQSGLCRMPDPPAARRLRAAASFLADAVYPAVPADVLVRMIGCYAFAADRPGCDATLAVTLRDSLGGQATALLARPRFEVESTAFGAAHILHEDQVLGLYILEIAAGRSIPAHAHRVMRESELILDEGLLLQGRPVAPGEAFAWPLGEVHCYRNPTGVARRILCVDSPRFVPGDEVPLDPPPPLEPAKPLGNYLA